MKLSLIFIVLASLFAEYSLGDSDYCPGYIKSSKLWDVFLGKPIAKVRLFTMKGDRLVEAPIQILPLSGRSDIRNKKVFAGGKREKLLSSYDRITMSRSSFSSRIRKETLLPCESKALQEISTAGKKPKYAYLALCKELRASFLPEPVISYDSANTVKSELFKFKHVPNNIMLFEEIALRGKGGRWYSAGSAGDLWLHLDVKSFFDINLNKSDLSADLQARSKGAFGIVHQLKFFIHILFFKIDLEMSTLFSFFEKSGHVPMKIDVPVNAWTRLNPGSGILLHWNPGDTRYLDTKSRYAIPEVAKNRIMKGYLESGKLVKKHCRYGHCRFDLNSRTKDRFLRIQVSIPEKNARRGLVPQYVPDAEVFVKEMGWDAAPRFKSKRIGIFFDNTGLAKGLHDLTYWFYPVDDPYDISGCPARFGVGQKIGNSQISPSGPSIK